jgi:NADH-quinone oxidoreductase subunit C
MSDTTVTDEATPEPEEPAAPADELREGQLARFTEALGDQVLGSHILAGRELWVRVDRTAWVAAAELARSKLGCTFFDFLSAIDWMPSPWGRYEDALIDKLGGPDSIGEPAPPAATTGNGIPYVDPASIKQGYAGGETRIQLLCRVADVRRGHGVVLKADLPDDDPTVASLTGVWAGANWHERECWEMFGVTFTGHPGLRHLYLPGAFEGNPLRKDFPLLARLVKPWPGIVDVEPMPGGDEPTEAEGDTAVEGAAETPAATTEAPAATTEAPAATTETEATPAAVVETTAPGDTTSEVEAEATEGHAESDADPEATAESAETAAEVEAEADAAADAEVIEAEAEAEADAVADASSVTDADAAAAGAADAELGATGADTSPVTTATAESAGAADDDGEAIAAAEPTDGETSSESSDSKSSDETDPEAGAS